MDSRSEGVARRQMWRFIRMIQVAIFVISPAAHALIGNKAYASEAGFKVSLPFQMCATARVRHASLTGTQSGFVARRSVSPISTFRR
ncbi:hypothetical protein [uncultured Agrobacterium sp.]|uniref:hypothetical protein n=1 Tax=uncultured Agrobacterium sp. TaxID=157277 RepID=UPI0025CBDD12|nr:hypothetical protein [uncultured Agrobacterium sp.]